MPDVTCRWLLMPTTEFACRFAPLKAGMPIAISRDMMEMTTRSSMRVNPL